MHVYMMVTEDEYELPLAVGNTAEELAKIVGTTTNAVLSGISHAKRGRGFGFSRYVKVEWEDEEE